MIKYHIIPNALIGAAYFKNEDNKRIDRQDPNDILSLEIQMDYGNYDHLLRFSKHLIVTDFLKSKLELEKFEGLSFQLFEIIERTYLEDSISTSNSAISFNGKYWKMDCDEANDKLDLAQWRNNLVVSEKGLQFLYKNKGFKDLDEGIHYGDEGIYVGPEFSMITNKFLIEGEIEDFFMNKMPKINEDIKQRRKFLKEEWQRRNKK